MANKFVFLLLSFFTFFMVVAQESKTVDNSKSGKLKVTGYMQPEWQLGEEAATLNVGKQKQEDDQDELFNRVGVRRGRIKFFYDDGNLGSGGFQFNVIDKPGLEGAQVQIKELYLNLKAPWNKKSSFQAGVFNRPFGFEVNYSSSSIESPERSRITTSLLPDECDLGGMIVLTPGESSPFNFLTFQGGFFAGNGINPETDNRKDFIGQLVASKSFGKIHMGAGVSYYNGGVFQTNDSVYSMNGNAFILDDATNKGNYSKREYIGFDAQLKLKSTLGLTQLRGEFIFGTQPGTSASSCSPTRSKLPTPENTYVRPFSGGYVMLIHDIGESPFSAVLKYEMYDPNSSVSGNDIGTNGSFTGKADIQYNTLGAGVYWQISPSIRTTLFYDMNANETSNLLSSTNYRNDYASDRKDNVLTMRLQYKF
jgi:phosphate-selective porin